MPLRFRFAKFGREEPEKPQGPFPAFYRASSRWVDPYSGVIWGTSRREFNPLFSKAYNEATSYLRKALRERLDKSGKASIRAFLSYPSTQGPFSHLGESKSLIAKKSNYPYSFEALSGPWRDRVVRLIRSSGNSHIEVEDLDTGERGLVLKISLRPVSTLLIG